MILSHSLQKRKIDKSIEALWHGESMRRALTFIIATIMMMILSLVPVDAQVDDEKLPDIRFEGGMEIHGSAPEGSFDGIPGDVLTIIVKIVNNGSAPAENVDVRLLVDGMEKKVTPLRSIKNDTDDVKTVIFHWVAEAGTHNFTIEIDPENSVIEPNDQFTGVNDNVLSRNVMIEEQSFAEKIVPFPGITWIFASMIPVLAFSVWKRNRMNFPPG